MKNLIALIAGLLFALGLVISGMTQPSKVIGFLDITGQWDPSLAFVMGGALIVTLFAFSVTPRHSKKPWYAQQFELPNRTDIDAKLIGGAALFGVGWGLVGYCPGPALASLLTTGADAPFFAVAMVVGMFAASKLNQRK